MGDPKRAVAAPANETTPLLQVVLGDESKDHDKKNKKKTSPYYWDTLHGATMSGMVFRRKKMKASRRPSGGAAAAARLRQQRLNVGMSDRGPNAFPFFAPQQESNDNDDEDDEQHNNNNNNNKEPIEPIEALSPLVAGGRIQGYNSRDNSKSSKSSPSTVVVARPRPPTLVKSIPAYAPYRRTARHRSFYLWWTNEFRHWWKSSRLLVRLAGLDTHARDPLVWGKMILLDPLHNKSMAKMVSIVKRLGQGGPMRFFLDRVQHFTRGLRILVGAWRWIEAAQCFRLEVGVEEFMAFVGNRVSRTAARLLVDGSTKYGIVPTSHYLFKRVNLPLEWWHPAVICIIMGILRACAPYAASFQGSRLGRVLTRAFFQTANHRWLPIQRIRDLNLAVSQERDEISENADLAKLAKKIAKALGKAQSLGLDGMQGQNEALAEEGFRQVGSGSGGYTVYECHRIVRFPGGPHDDERQTILLHLTPYGPSLLDVLPRYIVLEKENSQDRRAAWSETIASKQWEGPSVVEGYAYQGAFFSPHHFAEMKETYNKQLLAYDSACKAMAKPGRKAAAPTDLPTLKAFLADGKLPRKRKKNNREFRILQSEVRMVARKLKSMMSSGSEEGTAPRGVILYFEGLDCSGKSSTGGLVQQALNDAGFHVEMRQFNRPPTAEQKLRPWMDRFELPDTLPEDIAAKGETTVNDENRHRYTCVVWDRGPAGDFVYGAHASVAESEKRDRYREFIAFDAECRRKNILFVKLMFVTNRDSIASTLGKRLAQRKMAQDLRTWLKASYGDEKGNHDILMEGLDFIDRHIDPTDFIAFNMYQRNLRCFANFALNTDTPSNPWVVVNTSDRFAARKQLLKMFCRQLDTYAEFKRHEAGEGSCCRKLLCCTPSVRSDEEQAETPGIEMWQMANWKTKKGLSMQTVLALMGMLILLFLYGENTAYDNLKVK